MTGETSGADAGAADELAFLKGIETSTDNAPTIAAPEVREQPGETESEAKDEGGKPEGDGGKPPKKPEKKHGPSWDDNGNYRVEREDGEIVLNPKEVRGIAAQQRRFLTEKAKAAEVEATKAKERATALERELEAARSGKPAEKPAGAPADPAKPWTAKGAARPELDQFESVEAYMDARDEWKDAQSAPAKAPDKPADGPRMDERQAGVFKALVDAGVAAHEDFLEKAGPVNLPPPLMEALLESEYGAEVLYYLGDNPDEAAELAALEGNALARRLGRIEARIEASDKGAASDDDASPGPGDTPARPAPKPIPRIDPVKPAAAPSRDPASLAKSENLDGFFNFMDQVTGRA